MILGKIKDFYLKIIYIFIIEKWVVQHENGRKQRQQHLNVIVQLVIVENQWKN